MAPYLAQNNIDYSATLLLGGQIKGEEPRLFNIYAAGQFHRGQRATRIYFQVGESKYGKPILDRVLTSSTPHQEAAKCVLISFDSTIRSNISVGMPIDLLWYPRDSLRVGVQKRIGEGDPYFTMIRKSWGSGLRRVFTRAAQPGLVVVTPSGARDEGRGFQHASVAARFFFRSLVTRHLLLLFRGEGRGMRDEGFNMYQSRPSLLSGHLSLVTCHRFS